MLGVGLGRPLIVHIAHRNQILPGRLIQRIPAHAGHADHGHVEFAICRLPGLADGEVRKGGGRESGGGRLQKDAARGGSHGSLLGLDRCFSHEPGGFAREKWGL